MGLKRKKPRRKLEDTGKKAFFSTQSAEEKTPFFAGRSPLQRKLEVGRSNDPQEKEAESAAKQVTGQPVQKAEKKDEEKPVQKAEKKEEENPIQKAEKKEEEKPVQKAEKKEEEKPVQKAEKKEEEKPVQKAEKKEEEKPGAVQRALKPDGLQRAAINQHEESGDAAQAPSLEKRLARRKGMGFSLPDELRVEMERKFHASFREVRIHNDKEAEDICESLHALAFAHGHDIYFNKGQYNPNANTGKELLAHELAHVVQQNG